MTDLDARVTAMREQLAALARQVIAVTEAAGEQDKPDVVDQLFDVQRYLNDAAAVLWDVIVPSERDRMTTPAGLDGQVTAAREALHALRRTLLDLERAYADLDATTLDVNEAGDPTTAPEALERAVDGLRAAQDTLGTAGADLDAAKRHTARLKERE
ncbi:MAG: hypothetical protein ACRDTD_04460 [Pseudonocardiaceae bacterium]